MKWHINLLNKSTLHIRGCQWTVTLNWCLIQALPDVPFSLSSYQPFPCLTRQESITLSQILAGLALQWGDDDGAGVPVAVVVQDSTFGVVAVGVGAVRPRLHSVRAGIAGVRVRGIMDRHTADDILPLFRWRAVRRQNRFIANKNYIICMWSYSSIVLCNDASQCNIWPTPKTTKFISKTLSGIFSELNRHLKVKTDPIYQINKFLWSYCARFIKKIHCCIKM